jgi:SAM-dependent methyltransferase
MDQKPAIKAFLFECLEKKPYGHVLDLGCGDGELTAFVAKHIDEDVAGVELDPANILKCKGRGLLVREASIPTYIEDTHAGHVVGGTLVEEAVDDALDMLPLYDQSFMMIDSLPYIGKHDAINTIKRMQEIGSTILIVVPQGVPEPTLSDSPYEIVRSSWATHELERLDFSTVIVEDFYELGVDAIFACWTTSDVAVRGWHSFRQLLKQETWG